MKKLNNDGKHKTKYTFLNVHVCCDKLKNHEDANIAQIMNRDKLTSFNTTAPEPLVCQQVVQPMERIPDFNKGDVCDAGLGNICWKKTTKVSYISREQLQSIYIVCWKATLSCH